MTIKSILGVSLVRLLCLTLMILGVYFYEVNHTFFGFVIMFSATLFAFSGVNSLKITEDGIEFKFQRLIPIWTKTKTIKFHEIKLIKYSEGKVSVFSIIINLIAYMPGTIKPDDEILIELANGESFRHQRVGTKKQFLKVVELIKTRIKNVR